MLSEMLFPTEQEWKTNRTTRCEHRKMRGTAMNRGNAQYELRSEAMSIRIRHKMLKNPAAGAGFGHRSQYSIYGRTPGSAPTIRVHWVDKYLRKSVCICGLSQCP